LFTDNKHATVLSIISEISPPCETEWFARLNFTKAFQAWQELESAYAPRAELELQAKLEALETTSQLEGETIREWTMRLRRLTLEVKAMNGQHVITDTTHKLKLLRIRPVSGAEESCNTFLASIRYTLHLKTVQQVEHELIAYEEGIRMQTRLSANTSHSQVWHTRTGLSSSYTGRSTGNLPTKTSFTLPKEKGLCFICFNAHPAIKSKHHMRDCPQKGTALGRRVNELMNAHRASTAAKKASQVAAKKRQTTPVEQPPGAGF
jgi:hypothetical protein